MRAAIARIDLTTDRGRAEVRASIGVVVIAELRGASESFGNETVAAAN